MKGKRGNVEQAKDFKGAVKRLFTELKGYKILIFIAFVLAIFGSILSILAPDKLSSLTDEISKGLVLNTDALESVTTNIYANLNKDKIALASKELLNFDLSNDNIAKILNSDDITLDEKEKLNEVFKENGNILSLSDNTLKYLLSSSLYNEKLVSVDDKIALIHILNSKDYSNLYIPLSLESVFFSDITISNKVITAHDEALFVNAMANINKDSSSSDIYKALDNVPESIYGLIKPVMNIDSIKRICILLVVMYLLSAIFTYIQSICMTNVSNKFANNLRGRISSKINKLPLKYFDTNSIGDTLSRITNDVDTIAQTMNQSLASLVSSVTLFIGSIIMMFYTNSIMALTAILSSLIGFIGMFFILSKSQKYFVKRQEELGKLNGHIEEIYSGLNVVKAYNGKKSSDLVFDLYNKNVCESNLKSQFLSGLMMPMMNFIGNFGYVAVCIVGALLTLNGRISFGVIVAFISYVRLFTSPLSQIAQSMTSLQSTAAASERVFEFLDEKEMMSEDNITKVLPRESVKGEIEFCDVKFTYAGNDKPTIYDFSMKANPGEKIAIVGPTGAGKTTLVNLLMKFYDIDSGDIKIDGVSTKELTRSNIHDLFTMVLQDSWLFDGTIKENIVYNRSDITDQKIKDVCKSVGVHHFIKTLPNGYDSYISDNDSISAGQRQLLTIARAMILDSPFLILDEATSNVDTRTEELVQSAMDKLTKGKTSFIIAHRLSTIKNADKIIVMKNGNIVEVGTHDELIKLNGAYAELYNSQFEL